MELKQIKSLGATPKTVTRHSYGDILRPLVPYVTYFLLSLIFL